MNVVGGREGPTYTEYITTYVRWICKTRKEQSWQPSECKGSEKGRTWVHEMYRKEAGMAGTE